MQRLSIADLSGHLGPAFFEEKYCRNWILGRIHAGGAKCPYCSKELTGDQIDRFFGDNRLQCDACDRWYTARTGTILDTRVVSYRDIILIMVLTWYDHTTVDISSRLGIDRRTVARWQKDFGT